MPEEVTDAGAPQGLSWSWELDFDALMAAIAGADPSLPGASGADSSGTGSEPDHEAALDDANALQDDLGGPGPEEDDGPRLPAGALAGRVAERLAPGPDLAAWLAMAPADTLDDGDLAAVAGSWRRVASWAQARELAAVAQIASRAAARDKDIGTGPDGRPARVPASAAAEVALELTMSQYGASWWTDLAVTLSWQLAATGAALAEGTIDLPRARLIAEATGALSDEAARAVEERVLPAAGEQTTGMLRAALRRAVIAADPRGAEERRKESERRARVVLFPDEENTATLAGQRLPTVHAAAAMARIKAMARALKSCGAGGGMDLLCAQVYIGLLLGTLPLIPPAQGAPPDDPPGPPAADPPDQPAPPGPPDPPAADPSGPADPPAPPGPPGDVPGQGPPRGSGQRPPRGSGRPGAGPGEPSTGNADDHDPGAPRADGPGSPGNGQSPGPRGDTGTGPPRQSRRDAAPPGGSPAGQGTRGRPPASGTPPGDNPPPGDSPPASGHPPSANDPPPPDMPPPGQHPPTNEWPPAGNDPPSSRDRPPAGSDPPPGHDRPPAGDVPPPGDADAPRGEDDYPCPGDGPVPGGWVAPGQDDDDDRWPAADWPSLPAVIPPAFARPGATADGACPAEARPGDARPGDGAQPDGAWPGSNRSGLLDVSLPWQVLAGISAGPGHLGRIGPVTATQARRIAECAAGDPAAEWRIIVTTPEGAALAVTRIPRPRDPRRPSMPGLAPGIGTAPGTGTAAGTGATAGIGLVSRVTLTIPEDLAADPGHRPAETPASRARSRSVRPAAGAPRAGRDALLPGLCLSGISPAQIRSLAVGLDERAPDARMSPAAHRGRIDPAAWRHPAAGSGCPPPQ